MLVPGVGFWGRGITANLPDSLQGSAVAEKLEAICEYGFGDLETLEPPRGLGRD